jgi:ATP-dependent DNA helicase RecG
LRWPVNIRGSGVRQGPPGLAGRASPGIGLPQPEVRLLDTDVRYCKGVGPARAALLGKLGICTRGDLLLHVPRRYLDRRSIARVSALVPGTEATVAGEILHTSESRTRGGRRIFTAALSDGSGIIQLTFFSPAYVRDRLQKGRKVMASGRVEMFGRPSMVHPDLVLPGSGDAQCLESGIVLPVYALTAGLAQGTLRSIIATTLDDCRGSIPPVLPPGILEESGFAGRWSVFDAVHRPADPSVAARARRLLALEELFIYQLVLREVRRGATAHPGVPVGSGVGLGPFLEALPFALTRSQDEVLGEIRRDLASGSPMRRLLQGDVGCGKTVVAAAACWLCGKEGHQSAILSPTEVLAAQHSSSLEALLGTHGLRVAALTGGTPPGRRDSILEDLAAGRIDVLVGTHAILEPGVRFSDLALLVVDEQHKFGVEQRERLLAERTPRPHLLVMSATPIPRTLAMTFYGDLDVSRIGEMPPGRGEIETRLLRGSGGRMAFAELLDRLERRERAYVVYPLREASEKQDLRDATSSFEALSRGPAGRQGIGLLHGTMPAARKIDTARAFASGEISVLVSTTVIEVGIDVPEATLMIVAHAERFGLSQLHQLRGRIGRGGGDSLCLLLSSEKPDADALARLETLVQHRDGFLIAEKDLELRGPGDVLGTRQHGLPEFRVADLAKDLDLVGEASALCQRADPGSLQAITSEISWRFGGLRKPIA